MAGHHALRYEESRHDRAAVPRAASDGYRLAGPGREAAWVSVWEDHGEGDVFDGGTGVATLARLASLLRALRRRHGRERGDTPLTYRELAAKTGWAHGIIGDYFSGKRLPPTDRFDALVRLLGATLAEQGAFATARDRVEENRRREHRNRLSTVTPWELPRDVTMFTGREIQLAELDAATCRSRTGPRSPSCPAARTSARPRWQCTGRTGSPAASSTAACMSTCAAVLVADPYVPNGHCPVFCAAWRRTGEDAAEPELAARYRSLLAGRRMLVLLDDAHSAEQVRPLLPGGRTCFVLVTSRDKLSGLVARDGADRIELDRLTGAEARMLFRNLVGDRAIAEPRAVARLADQCARLPLAVRVAAELVVSRPHAPLSTLVEELRTGSA